MADTHKHVHATLGEGRSFTVVTGSGHQLVLDAGAEIGGHNAGLRPTEALLAALAGCAGIGIIGLLRKMRQNVVSYEIQVRGEQVEQHPQIFTDIVVEHTFTGYQLEAEVVERAIKLDEERYCAVNAILGKSAQVRHTYQIHEAADVADAIASEGRD